MTSVYMLEVLCFIKSKRVTLRKTVKSISIIQEANMTFALNLVIHLYFEKVCHTWVLESINACP